MSMSRDIKAVSPLVASTLQLFDTLSGAVAQVNTMRLQQKTRAALLALTDAEMTDIGLNRTHIKAMKLPC